MDGSGVGVKAPCPCQGVSNTFLRDPRGFADSHLKNPSFNDFSSPTLEERNLTSLCDEHRRLCDLVS